ncbi:MAG: class I SAM-dependent methyltransferase [candidate division WOR-3 bacterium]|nr:class I SAM-dependent methyltransferase [candidate division WOR-3 bacterium]
MAKTEAFDKYSDMYEEWFEENRYAYLSEIEAVRKLLPDFENGLEIGAGSGRFAEPLGIKRGVEPSEKMASIARTRGIKITIGQAEDLPFNDNEFNLELMVTSICFLDDIEKSLSESFRTLEKGGHLLIGLIDRESPIGKLYQKYKEQNVFYRHATFYSTDEIVSYLKKAGFVNFKFAQTIFRNLNEMDSAEEVKDGYGEGSFIVIRSQKP